MYVVDEGTHMEERRRELVDEVRALAIQCGGDADGRLSANLALLGDEIEAMSHGQLRRREARIAEALHVVAALLSHPSGIWRDSHRASAANASRH